MEEKQVTIDGETLPLAEPFFVIATENPIETTGTYPLPEAQVDRFMMKLSMGQLDTQAKRFSVRGSEVKLTPTELKIVTLLMKNPGRIFEI